MTATMKIIIAYLLLVNFTAAALTVSDKKRAKLHRWRIPERTLFAAALLGGAVGEYLTMRLIRHKTQHLRFMLGLPLIFCLQIAAAAAIYFVAP